jgi:serine/threonine protein kinase
MAAMIDDKIAELQKQYSSGRDAYFRNYFGLEVGGNYIIDALIGIGEFGFVFRAHNSVNESTFRAVKVFKADYSSDSVFSKGIINEVHTFDRLTKENVDMAHIPPYS